MLKTGKENCSGLTHLTSNRVVCGYKQIYPNKVRQFFLSHTLTHLCVTLVSPSSLCEPAELRCFSTSLLDSSHLHAETLRQLH